MFMKHGCIVKVNYPYNKRLYGQFGIIKSTTYAPDNYGVEIRGEWNYNSANGLFYIPEKFLVPVENEHIEHKDAVIDPFAIKNVYFNDPVTVIMWEDGTKTIVRCGENDIYDPEVGLAMAISKKALGNKGNYYEQFKKWLPHYTNESENAIAEEFVEKLNAIFRACSACKYRDRLSGEKPCCCCYGRPLHPNFKLSNESN